MSIQVRGQYGHKLCTQSNFDYQNTQIWMPLVGTKYKISSRGQIKNKVNKIMHPHTNNFGYQRVNIYINGQPTTKFVHRLVAETFLDNPDHYPEINHINEDPSQNDIDNLEWCDRQYNNRYGKHLERVYATREKHAIIKLFNEETKQQFNCMSEASDWLIHKHHLHTKKSSVSSGLYQVLNNQNLSYHTYHVELMPKSKGELL